MNDLQILDMDAEIEPKPYDWNTAVATQNAAWIAKFGLPDVEPGTAARMAAKEKEWAEWLASKANEGKPE